MGKSCLRVLKLAWSRRARCYSRSFLFYLGIPFLDSCVPD